jgi:hypothetical protein
MTDTKRFVVVPNHICGPAVIRHGNLVDTCPTVESAQRIADVLNALIVDADALTFSYAIPELNKLRDQEKDRVIRFMGKYIGAHCR